MKILLITPYSPGEITQAFKGSNLVEIRPSFNMTFSEDDSKFDWIVSYGCREIIRKPWIDAYPNKIVNVHVGFLPWNRGADPNFWSWFEGTPKGITIHAIDGGIDTGPIFGQAMVSFKNLEKHDLESTYAVLRKTATDHFIHLWPYIADGLRPSEQDRTIGTYHRTRDKEKWMRMLPKGLKTPVSEVQDLGRKSRILQPSELLASVQSENVI